MKNAILKLPKLVECADYHEFSYLQNTLRQFVEPKKSVKVKELGFNGMYVGIVYLDKLPTKDEIEQLSKDQKISLNFME